MEFSIGENLRRLRQQKGITQEQAAAVFGVSAQAVSRWENSSAYPDITLLPGLAIFYDTTVDAIVGMDEIRKEENLRKIHCRINELVIAGKAEEAVTLIRESLKVYPSDSGLLMSLGETLAHRSDDPMAAQEAVSIAQRILQNPDVSMKAKGTTTVNLLFLYLRQGKAELARELVRTLPHIWESRELLMPEVETGETYEAALRQAVRKALVFLSGKIRELPQREFGRTPEYVQLGVDFESEQTDEQMLELLRSFLEG